MKPLARYASLANYVDLTRGLGTDPFPLIRAVGLDPAGIHQQDRWVPADAIGDLLERTARATGRDDFGLRLAELRRLSHLGPLSLALREEPDVRSALDMLIRHQSMYNEAIHTRVVVSDGIATCRIELDLNPDRDERQSIDLAVGVLFGFLRELLGATWVPIAVSCAHSEPTDPTTARRLFGGAARYDRDFNGVVLAESDLDRPNISSDPQLRAYTQQLLGDVTDASGPSTTERTRQLVEMLLPTGRCSADQVALSLGVDRRTVHRRLTDEGTNLRAVIDDVRVDLARHLVAGRRYPMIEVAHMLGFEEAGNFSRWFRGRFGTNPRAWRADREAAAEHEAASPSGPGDGP